MLEFSTSFSFEEVLYLRNDKATLFECLVDLAVRRAIVLTSSVQDGMPYVARIRVTSSGYRVEVEFSRGEAVA